MTDEVKKVYFSSDEVMLILDMTRPKLLYWTNKLWLSPQKKIRKERKYTVQEINRLMYEQGRGIAG